MKLVKTKIFITMKRGINPQSQKEVEFPTYKIETKGGKLVTAKFVRTAKNIPTHDCTIYIKPTDINLDNTRVYPQYWIKDVVKCEDFVFDNKAFNDFEVDEIKDDDLPF